MAGHNVTHTVFVQAAAGGQYPNWKEASVLNETLRPLNEVEYCQGVASICDAERPGCPRICAGIVGWADFQDPEVEQLLIADCRVRNFRGIRTGPVCPHAITQRSCASNNDFRSTSKSCLGLSAGGRGGRGVLPRHGAHGEIQPHVRLRRRWSR